MMELLWTLGRMPWGVGAGGGSHFVPRRPGCSPSLSFPRPRKIVSVITTPQFDVSWKWSRRVLRPSSSLCQGREKGVVSKDDRDPGFDPVLQKY